jgi:SAM-dependent methyltransferase
MFIEETKWIEQALAPVIAKRRLRVLDIGSSSLNYRTKIQPHIHEYIHKPLQNAGCSITYADIKQEQGIDLEIDLSATNLDERIFAVKYDLIICCNILEHVIDRDSFMSNLARFSRPGTLILLTVPNRYPKHNDPIDTMYRPDPAQLRTFVQGFVKCRVEAESVISISEKQYYLGSFGRKLDYLTLRPLRQAWRYYLNLLRWQVTCLLIRVC